MELSFVDAITSQLRKSDAYNKLKAERRTTNQICKVAASTALSYKEIRAIFKGTGRKWEIHHVIQDLDWHWIVAKDAGISIPLDKSIHQKLVNSLQLQWTKALRNAGIPKSIIGIQYVASEALILAGCDKDDADKLVERAAAVSELFLF